MNEDINNILSNSILLFNDDESLTIFQKHINLNNWNQARYLVDDEIEKYNLDPTLMNCYNTIMDSLMNLIINEIDGEERNKKQFKQNFR